MGQFEKIWTRKDIAMDTIKLLEDSDLLTTAVELNERLPGKVQNTLLWLLKVLVRERQQRSQ